MRTRTEIEADIAYGRSLMELAVLEQAHLQAACPHTTTQHIMRLLGRPPQPRRTYRETVCVECGKTITFELADEMIFGHETSYRQHIPDITTHDDPVPRTES